ncbi:nuclear transport factor 2 family protein [Luteibacter yeojuensis]|nr:nuclear transport factor 2 family protein [Luteibacter yeojuensis]
MKTDRFPVGLAMEITYPAFTVRLAIDSEKQLTFTIAEGPFARTETVDLEVAPLGNGVFGLSWVEKSGATVTNIHDYDRGIAHSFATLAGGEFIRQQGQLVVTRQPDRMSDARPARNKALVVEAMEALFQRRDASAVDRLYAPGYVQHNPNIPQGRDALRTLVAGLSGDVYYEPGLVVAEGDLVAIHGRIRGWAPSPQVVVDIFRVENGQLVEHWDVLQDEVPLASTRGGAAMFDPAEGNL